MAANFDFSRFFDQEEWSDVTIKSGPREIKCHRLIIASKSEYFRKLLSKDSPFKENGQPAIELKVDDPDALYALLRCVYTSEYPELTRPCFDWTAALTHHVNLAITADKYGYKEVEEEAFRRIRHNSGVVGAPATASRFATGAEIMERLLMLPGLGYPQHIIATLEKEFACSSMPKLFDIPEFGAWLEARPKLVVAYLQRAHKKRNLLSL